jgi:hypothetical protein
MYQFVVVFHFTLDFHPCNLTWIIIDPGLTVRAAKGVPANTKLGLTEALRNTLPHRLDLN